MRRNMTKKERLVKEITKGVVTIIIVMMILMGFVLVSHADDTGTSLYMDVTVVVTTSDGQVSFGDSNGDVYNFREVTHSFKVGDKTTLEVIAKYSEQCGGFKVITMYIVYPK
jgi:hypothetical protein